MWFILKEKRRINKQENIERMAPWSPGLPTIIVQGNPADTIRRHPDTPVPLHHQTDTATPAMEGWWEIPFHTDHMVTESFHTSPILCMPGTSMCVCYCATRLYPRHLPGETVLLTNFHMMSPGAVLPENDSRKTRYVPQDFTVKSVVLVWRNAAEQTVPALVFAINDLLLQKKATSDSGNHFLYGACKYVTFGRCML